jgi:formylglycine-generating enzyme required for sulfatase activity
MHGNAWEWTQSVNFLLHSQVDSDGVATDIDYNRDITDMESRVLRGGSFAYQATNVRSANRVRNVPSIRILGVGFRPARTITP